MPDKLVVGPINKGLRTDVEAFNIDNDSFPVLNNAYQWRGRVLRKRGTVFFGRCTRFFDSTSTAYSTIATITLNGSGDGNILTGFGLQSSSSLVINTAVITAPGPTTYRDLGGNGYLTPTGTGGLNTINYNTGAIHIPAQAGNAVSVQFQYYPGLPVLGIEDINLGSFTTLQTLVFDQKYAYSLITTLFNDNVYSVSFYKNPPTDASIAYVQKITSAITPTDWNGQNYQQYQSVNYQGAFWVTNGVTVSFNGSNVGMQFAPKVNITYNINTADTIDLTIINCPLVVGDFVFLNEWTNLDPTQNKTLNFMSGYVISAIGNFASLNVVIRFPTGAIFVGGWTPGIVQYLTNRSDVTKDVIRWYDGDPTDGSVSNPVFLPSKGWVNFMPPLSRDVFSIAQLPERQYYLVGAKLIKAFKDRLVFFGPIIQTSTGLPIYLQDTAIYSQNGTAFYTSSFTTNPSLANTVFTPVLVPVNQTATAPAYWEDLTGFGGFITAGINTPIVTAESNEDVLILGTASPQMRFVYTGDDILPFEFYLIDDQLSTGSTFSAINMGSGVITRGNRGIIITTQGSAQRIDLPILDEVFKMNLNNNGAERFTAARDSLSEWIYFTYNPNNIERTFPSETIFLNYRDNSWGKFKESYTTYGQFQRNNRLTWGTTGRVYGTWGAWNAPWNASTSTISSPQVMGGNQQGFLLIRQDADRGGTGEGNSLYIEDYVPSTNTMTVPNHNLVNGDYIIISSSTGGTRGISGLNGNVYSVQSATANTFKLNTNPNATGTYIGGGLIKKIYVPFIQTKQFPVSWGMGRKTRIGTQQYLLEATKSAQITLLIFLSQNSSYSYNRGEIYPSNNTVNSSLIYSSVLYTCVESTNLGLTPANSTLQTITNKRGASPQAQIWHRVNTSLIGDTIQLGFTLSDAQVRQVDGTNNFAEIELHGFVLDISPSQLLS